LKQVAGNSEKERIDEPNGSDSGSSLSSSYGATNLGKSGLDELDVPPPPKMAFEDKPFKYGKSFKCPYCYTKQKVKNKTEWKSVILDIFLTANFEVGADRGTGSM
jgi:hypothetical protein